MGNIYQSISLTAALNIVAVGAGVFLGLDPIFTVLINGGSAILGELNSLHLQQEAHNLTTFYLIWNRVITTRMEGMTRKNTLNT